MNDDDALPPADDVPAWLAALPYEGPERYRLDLLLSADVYERLAERAAERGLSVEALAAELVEAALRAERGQVET